jgi:ETC complex I subunit conserved region
MGWTGSADPMAHFRLMFSNREAAVAYAERQGLAYEVRDSAKPVKTCPSVDQQLNRPMALWPIEVLSDGLSTTGMRLWSSAHNSFGVVVMIAAIHGRLGSPDRSQPRQFGFAGALHIDY